MRTYDYILAMREESQFIDPFDDSDMSSDDSEYDDETPEKPRFLSRFLCKGHGENQSNQRLSILVKETSTPANSEKPEIRIDPWKLIKMSKEKAKMAAEKARERLLRQKPAASVSPLKPLPLEGKKGPTVNKERKVSTSCEITPIVSNPWISGSTGGRFSSPRRRFSSSPSPRPQKYKSNFDLKLTEVSRELETYISRQVLCSALKKNGEDEASPRYGI